MSGRVLVVTPDDDLAQAVARVAAGAGADLLRERDGLAGLVTGESARPDVVIWDEEVPTPVAGIERLVAFGAGVIVVVGRGGVAAGVRALREGAEQFVIRPLDPEHLAVAIARVAEARRWRPRTLNDVERDQIERTLRHHGGNRTRAARDLGISRATLINKIRVYALNL